MRGIKSLITDISYLDPYEGIRYRGYTLPEVLERLPKPDDAEMPYVEGLYYLLLTGEIVITSYSIHYTKLYESWSSFKRTTYKKQL